MFREISILLMHYSFNKIHSWQAVNQGFNKLGLCEWPPSNKYGAKRSGMPPEDFAKLKHLWCVFHDFQSINFMNRFDFIKLQNKLKQPILNVSVVLTFPWLALTTTYVCLTLILVAILEKVLRLAVGSRAVSTIVIYTCRLWNHSSISRLSNHGMCLLYCKRIKQDGSWFWESHHGSSHLSMVIRKGFSARISGNQCP